MRVPRRKHAAALLPDGRVLVVGGSSERDLYGRYASAEIYEPRTGRFAPAGRMELARYKVDGSVLAAAGGVLVAGGGPTLELWQPARRTFRTVGRTGAALSFATATHLPGGDVLVTGGYDARTIAVSRRAWVYRAG